MPDGIRSVVEQIAGGAVSAARNCPGGFSPGLASRLSLADGGRVFVKAINGREWPTEFALHRAEARTAAALPPGVPAPRILGSHDDNEWVVLVFEDVPGREPTQPWRVDDFDRVIAAVGDLSTVVTPTPLDLPTDHPRLGGWTGLAADNRRLSLLPAVSAWAADHLSLLVTLEAEGLAAAKGSSLVHFDLYPHNILLTGDRVVFVDWPHACLGAPYLDLITVLSTAPPSGIDPEPVIDQHPLTATVNPRTIDAVLAALAGFHLATGLEPATPGMQPILEAKIKLGRSAMQWLSSRIDKREQSKLTR